MKVKHLIHLFGKWWVFYADSNKDQPIPLDIVRHSNAIYNVKDNFYLKNRYSNDKISDALKLRLWLDDDIQEYKYPGMSDFVQECHNYHMDLYK